MSNTDDRLPFPRRRPNTKDKAKDVATNFPHYALEYTSSLFPILKWISRYNLTWLAGDIIAGLTVGAVAIPQSMGYAKIANLPPEFGLYSSFVGSALYLFFATSKDVNIGPTSVMSLLVGQKIAAIGTKVYTAPEIATCLALFGGIIALGLGLFRLGFLIRFIPGPVIAGFTTGSAITISIGQLPNLLGISVNTQKAAYLILGNTLGGLPRANVNAALGLVSLFILYAIKYSTEYITKKYPRYERACFFIGILRHATIIILSTLIAWGVTRHQKTPSLNILKTVPSGFKHLGVPFVNDGLLSSVGGTIPIVVLILILEHIAIAKSFGRINNYTINPSQELIAIGMTNVIGSFFGAYPATGSFSRTALKAKAGVRTPLAGVVSSLVVVFALYFLTPAFYYIPNAALSAVIIHAVLGLISSPSYVKELWKIQFWDFAVFVSGVIITFFTSVEIGVYVSTGLALLVLLCRIAKPRIDILGRLALATFNSDQTPKYAYVPLNHPSFTSASNPPDGVLIFRFDEALTYPNASYIDSQVVDYAKEHTRRVHKRPEKKGDRSWNDAGSKKVEAAEELNKKLPRLHAVVFDFAAVSLIDSTGIQCLIDIRKELNKYAELSVEYHFANLLNEDIQNALLAGGFGITEPVVDHLIFQGLDVQGLDGQSEAASQQVADEENPEKKTTTKTKSKKFFHLTLEEAINSVGEW